jgi:uncharacterized membrane protein YczE
MDVPTATPERPWERRTPRLFGGLVLCGLGIAAMVAGDLGLGPWDVLHQGLSRVSGLPIGTVSIAVGAAVLLMWLPLGERPGWGTAANVVVIGVVIDLVLLVLATPASLVARAALTASGPVLFGIGSGFYLGAGMGSGPRDGVMTGLARRGWPVGVARTVIELTALGGGWALGGRVGVGTVLFAVTIGPIVHVTLPLLRVHDAPEPRPPRGVRSAR